MHRDDHFPRWVHMDSAGEIHCTTHQSRCQHTHLVRTTSMFRQNYRQVTEDEYIAEISDAEDIPSLVGDDDDDNDDDDDDDDDNDNDDGDDGKSDDYVAGNHKDDQIHIGIDDGARKFPVPAKFRMDSEDKEIALDSSTIKLKIGDGLHPELNNMSCCKWCNSKLFDTDHLYTDKAKVYCFERAFQISVYARRCINPECHHVILPDPFDLGLIHVDGRNFISVSLLNEYTVQCCFNSSTVNGFINSVSARYLSFQSAQPICNRKVFSCTYYNLVHHRQLWTVQFVCPGIYKYIYIYIYFQRLILLMSSLLNMLS